MYSWTIIQKKKHIFTIKHVIAKEIKHMCYLTKIGANIFEKLIQKWAKIVNVIDDLKF